MRPLHAILIFLAVLACGVSGLPAVVEPPAPQRPIRWASRTIRIAVSSSLTESSASIAAGSDVRGALQRALDSWSAASGIRFVVVSSKSDSISPAGAGDGVNLITVAPTSENLAIFAGGNNAARTRVHYDQTTGEISEADIVINPFPRSTEGATLMFTTDATPGTYDLESTFAHEIGHLLGLNHSRVIASTMQETQGINGTFGRPAIAERTLSEDDRAAVRALYGPCENFGAVNGKVFSNLQGSLVPAKGAQVWIEALTSGRVMASGVVKSNGTFSIGCLPVGDYRALVEYSDGPVSDSPSVSSTTDGKPGTRLKLIRRAEISSLLKVWPDEENPVSFTLIPPPTKAHTLHPQYFGINGDLSTVPVSAEAGTKLRFYIGGQGVDQVAGNGLLVSSPFMTIDPASIQVQSFDGAPPVISFELTIAKDVPAGDYTVRLQSASGELAYLVGAITVNDF